jgi:hypothetical protein
LHLDELAEGNARHSFLSTRGKLQRNIEKLDHEFFSFCLVEEVARGISLHIGLQTLHPPPKSQSLDDDTRFLKPRNAHCRWDGAGVAVGGIGAEEEGKAGYSADSAAGGNGGGGRAGGGALGGKGGEGSALLIQKVYRGHIARSAVRGALEELYRSLDESGQQYGEDDDGVSTRCADEISLEIDGGGVGGLLDPSPGGGLVIPKGHDLLAGSPRGHDSRTGAHSAGAR